MLDRLDRLDTIIDTIIDSPPVNILTLAIHRELAPEILLASNEEISNRTKLLENDIKIMKSDQLRITHEQAAVKAKIKENQEKVKLNKQLPYLVSNVVEVPINITRLNHIMMNSCFQRIQMMNLKKMELMLILMLTERELVPSLKLLLDKPSFFQWLDWWNLKN